MAEKVQSFSNHTKIDPAFHQFLIPVALILLIAAITNLVRNLGWESGFLTLAMIWAIVALFRIRLYALKVQDRVIRLEERLRLQRVLPPQLQGKIQDLKESQLIALRFASDGELTGLVEKTLGGNLPNKEIKQAIQSWRPDEWRV